MGTFEALIALKTLFFLIISHFIYKQIKRRKERRKEMAIFQYEIKDMTEEIKDNTQTQTKEKS